VGIQFIAVAMEVNMEVHQKLKIEPPCNPVIACLGINPREYELTYYRDT
jgi:hypothetical protein